MIDIHNHIIYEFDDGPKSLNESLEMLRIAVDQGIKAVFATSHFSEVIHPEQEKDYFEKLQILRDKIQEKSIPIEIFSGSEMFYHHYLEKTAKQSKVGTLCALGQYVLMEFPLYLMPSGVEETLFRLSVEDITPIIAHPERYSTVIDHPAKVYDFLKHGALLQVNAGSVLGKFGRKVKKVAMWLLENNLVHFIGSDAHSPKGRTFELANTAEYLKNHLDENYLAELVEKNAQNIIDNKRLEKIQLEETEEASNLFLRFKRKLGL
ncbi:MAG: hypothetical protein D6748_11330 [Calditrichaeota bacterium]|nr:MAG: hypothetical protein D6748_11330 [Calditrichota bacterium]